MSSSANDSNSIPDPTSLTGLNALLSERPLSEETKQELAEALWTSEDSCSQKITIDSTSLKATRRTLTGLKSYFAYYEDLIGQLESSGFFDLGWPEDLTHNDIVRVINTLHMNPTCERRQILKIVKDTVFEKIPCTEEQINPILVLAIGAWLMIDIWDIEQRQSFYPYGEPATWDARQTLQHFLESQFQICAEAMSGERLPTCFNAYNLERMGGICIVPTYNLVEHLVFDDESSALQVFHMSSYLEKTKQCPEIRTAYPPDLISETLDTLTLLFPYHRSTKKFLRYKSRHQDFDIALSTGLISSSSIVNMTNLSRYKYWRNRLIAVNDYFKAPKVRSLPQLWYDRRKGLQWYTYWIANSILAMTLFFGMLSSVTGVMQVIIAAKGLEEQRAQSRIPVSRH